MLKLVAATKNHGKLQELQQVAPPAIKLVPLPKELPAPNESGATYLANAMLKARFYYQKLQRPVLADDGGLELAAFPDILGLKTQRFFTSSDPKQQNAQLLALFASQPEASRAFTLQATLVYFDGQTLLTSHAQLTGLVTDARGTQGFGFDPILYVPNEQRTLAQLTAAQRAEYSPRVQAFRELSQQLKKRQLIKEEDDS